MTEKEALKLALEALKYPLNQSHENFNVDMAELLAHRAITAIKEALAEQPAQQEPAGSVYRYGKDSSGKQWHGIRWTASGLDLPDGTLIYTSPPQQEPVKSGEGASATVTITLPAQRTWVGLTDEEVDEWTPEIHSVIRAIEAKLRSKNEL